MNDKSDISYVAQLELPWNKLKGKTVLISGASGMIGSFLIHVLMKRNEQIYICALGRNSQIAKERFGAYWENKYFRFIEQDINMPFKEIGHVDFVIHAASNTHPLAYASDPIGTITTNIIGSNHMLDYALRHHAERFLFASSVEIYGENRGDCEYFSEEYCGYINSNTLRAGYPESKRAGEALCQAYRKKSQLNVVIARFARVYGPSMLPTDTKAISQFIKKGIAHENIVLKSEGHQLYSYCYVADAVSALLTILLEGSDGEAYNIADTASDITLRNLAQMIAEQSGVQVVFELPSQLEAEGYSKATKALLDSKKLNCLGWKPHWNIEEGISRTIAIGVGN